MANGQDNGTNRQIQLQTKERMSQISIHHLEVLMTRFENKEFGIEELQSRINTAPAPDPDILWFSAKIHDLDNELELIL